MLVAIPWVVETASTNGNGNGNGNGKFWRRNKKPETAEYTAKI